MNREELDKLTRKKLIISAFTLLTALFMLILATVAWFSLEGMGRGSVSAVIDTKGEKLYAWLYQGKDIDLDNELDGYILPEGEEKTRATDLSNQYYQLDKKKMTDQKCIAGSTRLFYKAIIVNPNDYAVKLSLNYDTLDDYFWENIGETDTAKLDEIIKQNSARVMFRIDNITYQEYKNDDSTDYSEGDEESAYLTKVGEKIEVEGGGGLWDFSQREPFAEGITVAAGDLIEIDFQLKCMPYDEFSAGYTEYWNEYIKNDPKCDAESIKRFYTEELRVLATRLAYAGDAGLTFTVGGLSVRGEQSARK